MKKYLLALVLGIITTTSFFYFYSKDVKEMQKTNFSKPYEDYFLSHNYPIFTPSPTAYQLTYNDAKNKILLNKINNEDYEWYEVGPDGVGGRINCVVVKPNDNNVMLVGAASGGIFKTTNGGSVWYPVFDNEAALAVSSIVYDPSNTNIIYAGTGDKANSSHSRIGNGIYKSTNGGETWSEFALSEVKIINKIIVHPTNSNIIYVAAIGNYFSRNPNKGIYKTTDGGSNWDKILYIDDETGFSDIHIHNSNPDIIFATSYRRFRSNQQSIATSENVKIFKSSNAGLNWEILENGLPNYKVCKIMMDIAPSDPNTLYASYVDSTANLLGLFKSSNGGNNWVSCPTNGISDIYKGFGWYFHKIAIHPTNTNTLYLCGVELYRTTNSGTSWNLAAPTWSTYEVHADKHDLVFLNNNSFLLSTDGGLYKTTNSGSNYNRIENIPIVQLYRIEEKYFIYGGAQDNGTWGYTFDGIGQWEKYLGGDGFQVRFFNHDSNVMWGETQNGRLYVSTNSGGWFITGFNGIEESDRRNWDMPYIVDYNDYMYTGTYRVYANYSGASPNWEPISDDLTDGNTYGSSFHTISAIDKSKINDDLILVGTSDANVWKSTNNGNDWIEITNNLPERYVSAVRASPNNPNNIYVTHTGYRDNDHSPHIHKSTDLGNTWISIQGDLPNFAIYDVEIYEGLENYIFVATDGGVYYTSNGGLNWKRLGYNMPIIPVFDIIVKNQYVIAGTFARSIQIIYLDDNFLGISIPKSPNNSIFSVYPNPTQNDIYFDFEIKDKLKPTQVLITNLEGKKVYQQTIDNSSINHNVQISNLPQGTYLINIVQFGRILKTSKFAKQ
jgi:photosystem II stability/assembly factor-like uncharacterized protein